MIRPPCGKKPYVSRSAALAELGSLPDDPRRRETREYRCPTCGFWHLTSRPGWVDDRVPR